MAKNGVDGSSPIRLATLTQGAEFVEAPAAERSPAKPELVKDCESPRRERQFAEDTRKDGREALSPTAEASTPPTCRSHRELGTAILAGGIAVKTGRELLEKETSEDRGAATRLKSLQTFADWAFERPGTEGYRKPPRIIWDIPGPPYEPLDPELEKLEGGEK